MSKNNKCCRSEDRLEEEMDLCDEDSCAWDCCEFDEVVKVWEVAPFFYGTAYHDWKFVDISSDMFLDKWLVLFFYPADFTFVCPTELAELQENYDKLLKMWVEVVSVSTDKHFTHMWWAASSPLIKNIKFPMLWDPSWDISIAYDVYKDNWYSERWTFIIDPDWVLQSVEISADWIWRSAQELIRKLEALQHVRKHPDVVCPINWKKTWTLSPWEDLVWKI